MVKCRGLTGAILTQHIITTIIFHRGVTIHDLCGVSLSNIVKKAIKMSFQFEIKSNSNFTQNFFLPFTKSNRMHPKKNTDATAEVDDDGETTTILLLPRGAHL